MGDKAGVLRRPLCVVRRGSVGREDEGQTMIEGLRANFKRNRCLERTPPVLLGGR